MAEENKIAARNTVGMVLMGSEEADVAVELLQETRPDLRINKTNCYYMIEGEDKIEIDVREMSAPGLVIDLLMEAIRANRRPDET